MGGLRARSRRSRRVLAALVGMLVLGGIVGGISGAAAPQPQKLIHACYDKETGVLIYRAYCTAGEKNIFWPAATLREPSAVIDVFEPKLGAEPKLVEGKNSIMTLTKPTVWGKSNREQVVLATLVLQNRGVFLPAVSCTASHGSALFSVPAPVGQGEYYLTTSFQAPAGGLQERTISLVCDVIDPPATPDVRVMRASLTVIPQN